MSAFLNGLIFLDLDGTIEDSREDMANAAASIRNQLGLEQRPTESFFPYVIKGMEFLYRQCFPEALADPSVLEGNYFDENQILLELDRIYTLEYSRRINESTRCYPGMAECLAQLASDYTLALYTNKPEGLSKLLLEKLEIASHFQLVYGGDTLPESKPSALPLKTGIQQIARTLGCDATEVQSRSIMVGDSAGDIVAARNANIRSIWAGYGYYAEQPPGADAVARQPSELPALIAKILD